MAAGAVTTHLQGRALTPQGQRAHDASSLGISTPSAPHLGIGVQDEYILDTICMLSTTDTVFLLVCTLCNHICNVYPTLQCMHSAPLHVREEVVVAARQLPDLGDVVRIRPDTNHAVLHFEYALRRLRVRGRGSGPKVFGVRRNHQQLNGVITQVSTKDVPVL